MNTILVSLDFSTASENAMHYAVRLAQITNSSILLLYTYQIPISLNDAPILMIPAEELKKNADENLERSKELLLKNYPGLDVQTESRLGDVVDELNDVCNIRKPLVIVIGKHQTKGMEKLVFGDADMSIIRHSKVPILSVPDSTSYSEIRNIAFASDGTEQTMHLQKIREFVQILKSQLYCIHVQTSEKEEEIQLNNILPDLNPACETIKDEHFTHALQTFLLSRQIDLLILIPHKHNLVERLFYKTHTATVMEKLTIPVLCIPY